MVKTKIIFLGCGLLCCGIFNLYAQSNTVASAGVATGVGGTASYSFGQIDYIATTGNTESITQGVQQPYEIFVVPEVKKKIIILGAAIYPNPTTNSVTLAITNAAAPELNYLLFDEQGRLIRQQKITAIITSIDMENLNSGIYFIKMLSNGEEVKTFKIIKNL